MRRTQFLAFAIIVPALWIAGPRWAGAASTSCAITAMDARAGIVTASEGARRRTFQFKVNDATLLRSLKVGQKVLADFTTGNVTLAAGQRPCCSILATSSPLSTPGTGIKTVTAQAALNPAVAALAVNPTIILPDLIPHVTPAAAVCSWDESQGQTCESECPPSTLNIPIGTKNISSRPLNGAVTIKLLAHPSSSLVKQWSVTNVPGAGQQTPGYVTHTFVFCHPPGVHYTSPPPPNYALMVETPAIEADKNNNGWLIHIDPGSPIGP
jgi:hypothetical protein